MLTNERQSEAIYMEETIAHLSNVFLLRDYKLKFCLKF